MKITQLGVLINSAFNYVIQTSNFYSIDESHALKHSMEVFHLTNKIYFSSSYFDITHDTTRHAFFTTLQNLQIYIHGIHR